jgi:Ca2+-transporting ATPase
MIEWHAIEKKEAESLLKTESEKGLSEHEAKSRLDKYGKNEIRQIARQSAFFIFLQQFKSIFIMILILAAIFAFFIQRYIDFSVIIAIILLNSAIGFFQQYQAEKTIAKMKALLVPKVKVFREGKLLEISALEIVPGDLISLSEGDKIMADCRIVHSINMEVNEAVLTGESFPQSKTSGILKSNTELANRENMLYTGTLVVRGSGKALVVSTGMNTEFGKIAGLVQKIKPQKTPLESKLDDFSGKVALVVVFLAVTSILIGILRGQDTYYMILTGISLAISVIPEGIPAVIAITLALAIRRMQKHHSLIRKLPAAETLGRTTVICVDKTGTLTEEEMTVTRLYCNKDYYSIKDHKFYNDHKSVDPLKSQDLKDLLKIGIMCNNARLEKDEKGKIIGIIGDPTEKALVISAEKAGLLKKEETEKEIRVMEYSFSSKRKLMSIVRKSGRTFVSYVKGAPDLILKKCTRELVNGQPIMLTEKRKSELINVYENMASQALRVLGFAFRTVPSTFNQELSESGLIFAGFQAMMDPPRKEVEHSIRECLDAGIKIKMLTGDSLHTAVAVSNQIGLDGQSIEEHELQNLSEKEFRDAVVSNTVFARITPETKLRIIRCLKEQKEIVAVTGDGVNDVLALKEAHIGVAMGIRGTDVARDVSDIILLDDNFSSIVRAVKEGRRVYDNMKKSITAHLAANVDELFVVLFAILISWPLPFLPLAILWMNLVTDSLPSLSLAFEPPDEKIMKRKPRNPKDSILTGITGFLIIAGVLSFIITIGLFALYFQDNLEKARTVAITAAIFCEMFIVISCRSERNIWKIGFFSNKFLIYSILIAIAVQLIAIYTPLALVFGFTALSLKDLLIIALSSSLILVLFEFKKFLRSQQEKYKV